MQDSQMIGRWTGHEFCSAAQRKAIQVPEIKLFPQFCKVQ